MNVIKPSRYGFVSCSTYTKYATRFIYLLACLIQTGTVARKSSVGGFYVVQGGLTF